MYPHHLVALCPRVPPSLDLFPKQRTTTQPTCVLRKWTRQGPLARNAGMNQRLHPRKSPRKVALPTASFTIPRPDGRIGSDTYTKRTTRSPRYNSLFGLVETVRHV